MSPWVVVLWLAVSADPVEAFGRGAYDEALQGFTDLQVERPDDLGLAMNIGSTHYKMRNFAEAKKSFERVALGGDKALRERALYNLGNVAYGEGKLDEAVQRYQAALELDPNDEDAKVNLELVRNEIRRRHEEAKKRQQEQQQQGGQDGQQPPGEPQDGEQPPEQGEKEGEPRGEEGEQQQGEQQDGKEQQTQGAQGGSGPSGSSGPEAQAGKTDDEKSDQAGEQQGAASSAQRQGAAQAMSKEEAERYLKALQEAPPDRKLKGKRLRAAPGGKDW